MFSSGSSYTLPRTTSYISPSRYSSVTAGLPPISSRYVSPSRYSSYTTTSSLSRPSTVSASRYSSSYVKPSFDSDSWRTYVRSPSPVRRDSSSLLTRTSSYSSGSRQRSGSISSLSSSSVDTYRSSSLSSYVSSSGSKDIWTPRTYRLSSVSSEPPAKTSPYTSTYGYSKPVKEANKLAGRVGLHNLGNTCFMNAVLQCLCHTKPLVDYCMKGSFSSDLNHRSPSGGELIKAFASLMNVLWKDTANDVSPDQLKRELQKYSPRFSGYSQQDAQELLRYLLQGLHEDVNRAKTRTQYRSCAGEYATETQRATDSWRRYQHTDDSKIVDLFGGQLKSTLKCTECGHVSVTFDPFWDLSLPIPESGSKVTLQQCFRLFSTAESLDGHEKPMCERCKKKTRSTKQLMINKFPIILVIHLKRFSSGSNYRNKLNVTVDSPQRNLDLSEFATTSCNSSTNFNLFGVVDHFGSCASGHYTAKCKNPYTEEWNEFNDTTVTAASKQGLVTDKAYLLFYEQARQGWSSRL